MYHAAEIIKIMHLINPSIAKHYILFQHIVTRYAKYVGRSHAGLIYPQEQCIIRHLSKLCYIVRLDRSEKNVLIVL